MSSSDISLSSAEEMMSVSSGGSPSTFSMFPRRNRTIPELLAAREGYGMSNTSVVKKYRVDSSLLSYRGAWNAPRLQNMILAVGPGTPASVVMTAEPTRLSSSSDSSDAASTSSSDASSSILSAEDVDALDCAEDNTPTATEDKPGQFGDDDDGNGDCDVSDMVRAAVEARRCRRRILLESDDEENVGDPEVDDSNDDDSDEIAQRIAESALMEWYGADDDDGEDDDDEDIGAQFQSSQQQKPVPSMRHGGCINTAAWLDCGWRLSFSSSGAFSSHAEAIVSDECPTQLITSGDDHLVKFWDVRHAMGTTSPLPGGYCTLTPFSSPTLTGSWEETKQSWEAHYARYNATSENLSCRLGHHNYSGSVIPLATLHTGHRGNVFHVTPVRGRPGKVATCGADGFLRLIDLEESGGANGDASCSSVIVSPEYDDDLGGLLPAGMLSLRPGMCFSHHFLNHNTGLLCSERGLRRFDLRLPPREQPTESILGGPFRGCKACAVWSSASANSLEEGDSAYVFAGGSSADVVLCDLRMITEATSDGSRVVQHYRPKGLETADHVSVSGLDLSRDRQELLVSYESDQIYTFPVFSQLKSAAGPTLDDLGHSRENGVERTGSRVTRSTKVLNELAAYGGHLNRFTFLKNAKYAGPNDEYICTGSDSGHAWIYEKSTGSVVSLLNADHSTCNGVIPHPSLPIFITYGIDSTAKLWRGTIPVGPHVDDSPAGRAKSFRNHDFVMSPATRKWSEVQHVLKIMESEDCKYTDILPDHIPNTRDILHSGRFGRSIPRRDGGGPKICNDLHNLPDLLRQNLYACLRSLVDGDDEPVESDIEDLKRRVSIIRLRHQADRLGAIFNPTLPWVFQNRIVNGGGDGGVTSLHPADLVPDNPSDWISYDSDICQSPWEFTRYFNTSDYGEFYRERYLNSEALPHPNNKERQQTPPWFSKDQATVESQLRKVSHDEAETMPGVRSSVEEEEKETGDSDLGDATKLVSSSSSSEEEAGSSSRSNAINTLLYETMLVLKDGGNEALQEGEYNLAANRYDKAIKYGAIAFMSFPVSNSHFANGRRDKLRENGGFQLDWTPLLKLLVVIRLNLSLLMLKPFFAQFEQAAEQASLALHELKPFCASRGKVMKGSKLDSVHREDEPGATFEDATTLQAKGYFRLGTAHYEMKKYPEAIRCFENSIKSSQHVKAKPDALVLRRLSEAKRENRRKNKRHRKKFKLAFGANEHQRKRSTQEGKSEERQET